MPWGSPFNISKKQSAFGIKKLNSNDKGDLFITINIEVPKKLTSKQKELLRQFDESISGAEPEKKKGIFGK